MNYIKHYIGACNCVIKGVENPEIFRFIGLRTDRQEVLMQASNGGIVRSHPDRVILLLRPLSSMTDDEVRQLCRIVNEAAYGDYRYSKWMVSVDAKNQQGIWDAVWLRNKNSGCEFMVDRLDGRVVCYEGADIDPNTDCSYLQWYYEKGFDIPTYPDGKTMKELGLATYENL